MASAADHRVGVIAKVLLTFAAAMLMSWVLTALFNYVQGGRFTHSGVVRQGKL